MDELYVFAVMSVVGEPPDSNQMEFVRDDCTFMPLGEGQIFTIDKNIWKVAGRSPEFVCFPDASECSTVFQKALEPGVIVLVGLIRDSELDVPGRGVTDLEPLHLGDTYRAIDAGYDVTDLWGLSAISDCGYTEDDMVAIRKLGISANEYGLIDREADGLRFAAFADRHVEEHAPFQPIKIKIIQPK